MIDNSIDIFLNKFYLGFACGKKKFEGDSPLLPGIYFCCYVCVAQQIINGFIFMEIC